MKNIVILSTLGLAALGGCTVPQIAGTAAVVYATRPDSLPPADTKSQIPEHETWCYTTMAETQCFTKAQPVSPTRLVNVEPQNRYPLTPEDYRDELAGKRQVATERPEGLGNMDVVPVEKGSFMERNFWF